MIRFSLNDLDDTNQPKVKQVAVITFPESVPLRNSSYKSICPGPSYNESLQTISFFFSGELSGMIRFSLNDLDDTNQPKVKQVAVITFPESVPLRFVCKVYYYNLRAFH